MAPIAIDPDPQLHTRNQLDTGDSAVVKTQSLFRILITLFSLISPIHGATIHSALTIIIKEQVPYINDLLGSSH